MFKISVFLFVWLFCSIGNYNCVKREDFKTCNQSGFCNRQRHFERGQASYVAHLNKISQQSSIEFVISEDSQKSEYIGEIQCYLDNTFRFQMKEKDPIRPRYFPSDALKNDAHLLKTQCLIKEHNDNELIIKGLVTTKNNEYNLIVYSKPFSIFVLKSEQTILTLNTDGLLNFETFKNRKQSFGKDSNDSRTNFEQNSNSEPFVDLIDDREKTETCSESFKGHVDSNPFCHQSIGLDVTFWNTKHVYGIPEHADSFKLRSTCNKEDPYRLFNLDVCNYEINNQMALYGSVPYMLSHSVNQTTGVLWLNAAETWVDVNYTDHQTILQSLFKRIKSFFKFNDDIKAVVDRVQTRWMSESGNIDVFIFMGPKPTDVFRQYSMLTGTTQLPPLSSLGYHMSRWNYFSQSEVLTMMSKAEENRIPFDFIWLDIEYTNGLRYFTWNPQNFHNPKEMTDQLSLKGHKLVIIIDPHIKKDSSYHIYNAVSELQLAIKDANNETDFVGHCWPGASIYIDFLNPIARSWYSEQYNLEKFPGTTLDTHLWNDMNEPSVFSGPEITINKDTLHYGGWENRDIHNIYGMLMHLTTSRALINRSHSTRRPFVLSRAFFAGSQRAGAVWTGDNTNTWEHLQISIPMLLSLSITGISFCGADVGGFFDSNKEIELFVRWHQAAVFQPLYRVHSHIDSMRREPWTFDIDSMKDIRHALELRYSMIPFWYSLFYQNELSGTPPMQPLWSVFPNDEKVFDIETSYMLGSQLLISPVIEPKISQMTIYLPGADEIWYDTDFNAYNGSEEIVIDINRRSVPRFQRGGTIIPYKLRKRRSSQAMINDPYTLYIALNQNKTATGFVFMDDGQSFNYIISRSFYYRRISYDNGVIISELIAGSEGFKTREWIERIVICGIQQCPSSFTLNNGRAEEVTCIKELGVVILRKPAVNANSNWTIRLEF